MVLAPLARVLSLVLTAAPPQPDAVRGGAPVSPGAELGETAGPGAEGGEAAPRSTRQPEPAAEQGAGAPASDATAIERGDGSAAEAGDAQRSDTPPAYRTVVVSNRDGGDGLAAQRALSRRSVGFVTAIDLEREPGRPPADDLARVISRAPGVTVRSLGGLGQFTAVSLRGSSSQQVPVFLDGAPLTGSAAGLVDLSTQPLDALARAEIHRGYVPVRYGSAAIGGAIDLVGAVHRGPPKLWAAAGFGSFLAREARLGFATQLPAPGRLSLAVRLGYAGARGDFPYFDDGSTPLVPDDDGFARRANNGYERVLAQLRLDARRGALRVAHQNLVWWKTQGIPNAAGTADTQATQRSVALRSITRVRYLDLGPGGELEWVGSFALEDRVFRDPLGRVGLAIDDERGLTLDGWLSPRLRLLLWGGERAPAWLSVVAELRGERVAIDERAAVRADPAVLASGDATRTRFSGGLGLELEQWLFRRWLLVPGVRVDLAASRFAVPEGEGELDDAGRNDAVIGVTPRLGSKLKLVPGLDARVSVGRYLRFPNLTELFGDRGFIVGNEGLRPESGTKVDGGLVLDLEQLAGGKLGLFAELAGFATWSEDLIQWLRSGPVVRPVNVEGARVRGLEAGAGVRAFGRDLALDLSYTLLDSRNDGPEAEQRGKPLPGRPRHTVVLRPSAGHRFVLGPRAFALELRAFYELEWIAGNLLDLSGRLELPPRTLHALGLSLRLGDRVELAVEGRNLGNQRVAELHPQFGPPQSYPVAISDFIGFPLPGRSVWATLRVDLELPCRASQGCS